MVVLIDTNVVLDYIAKREPYAEHANRIVKMCTLKEINGCVAAHTIINLFFILRNELSIKQRKSVLLKMCRVFTVIGIDNTKILSALENDSFNDFEDCLQDECADDFNADYLITRNIKDFKNSKVKAIEPNDFLLLFKGI